MALSALSSTEKSAYDQALKLNRICGAAFAKPKQFAEDWTAERSGMYEYVSGGKDSGVAGVSDNDGDGKVVHGAILPRSLQRIHPAELDFGGNVSRKEYVKVSLLAATLS